MNDLTPQEMDIFEKSLSFPSGRKYVISKTATDHPENWQSVETPYDIGREMVDVVPKDADGWIVFFSMEFLEVLVKEREVLPEAIMFIADNELEVDIASHPQMYGVESVLFPKQDVNAETIKNIIGETNMKFKKLAVIGNPPYQEEDGGHSRSAKPLYHKFIEAIIDGLNPDYFTFIVPSRWMVGGKGLDRFRDRMMHDRRMKKIVHFPGDQEVFPTVYIKGGVNYFLWQKDHNGKCEFVVDNTVSERFLDDEDIILQDNNAAGILAKVKSVSSDWVSELCYAQKPFGLRSNFSDFLGDDANGSTGAIGPKEVEVTNNGATGATDTISGHGTEGATGCMCKGHEKKFVASDIFSDKHNIFKKWKVCMSRAINLEDGVVAKSMVASIFVLEPNTICTETYIVVADFDNKSEADHFSSYMQTKFFRYMLGLRVTTQDVNRDKFSFVPDVLDYTCPWTDAELYKKYKLTRQEIAYIESKIKELK